MPENLINGAIQAWGLPVALIVWYIFDRLKTGPKKDPTAELIDTLKALTAKMENMNDRIIRLETRDEMRGK